MGSTAKQLTTVYYYNMESNLKNFQEMFDDFANRYNDNVILKRLKLSARANYDVWVSKAERDHISAAQMEEIVKSIEDLSPKISSKMDIWTGAKKAIGDKSYITIGNELNGIKGAGLNLNKMSDVQKACVDKAGEYLENSGKLLKEYLGNLDDIFQNISTIYSGFVGLQLENIILNAIKTGGRGGKGINIAYNTSQTKGKDLFSKATNEAEAIVRRIYKADSNGKVYAGPRIYPSIAKIYLLKQKLHNIYALIQNGGGNITPEDKINAAFIMQGVGGLLNVGAGLAVGEVGLAGILPMVQGTLIQNLKATPAGQTKVTVDKALDEYGNKMTRSFNISKGDLVVTGTVKNNLNAEVELSFPVSVKISAQEDFNINSSEIQLLNSGSWGDVLYHFGITKGKNGLLALANAVTKHYNLNNKNGTGYVFKNYSKRAQSIVNKMSCYYAMAGVGDTQALFLSVNGNFIAIHKIFDQLENLNSFSFSKEILPPVEGWYGEDTPNIDDARVRTQRVINKMYDLKLGTVSWKMFLAR